MSDPERPETGRWTSPPGFPALLWEAAPVPVFTGAVSMGAVSTAAMSTGAAAEHTGRPGAEPQGLPAAGAVRLDPHGRRVFLDGQAVTLTAKEYMLTELLLTAQGRLFGRDDILERVWGLDFPGDARIVDTYVKRLRGKLGAGMIETVRGLGYRCPLSDALEMAQSGVAQPHLQRLPPEARLLTRLAQRILQVTDPLHIIAEVYALLREQYGVQGVSLWSLPSGDQPGGGQPGGDRPGHEQPEYQRLAHAGQEFTPTRPAAGSGPLALIPLGSAATAEHAASLSAGQGSQGPWALLAFWGGQQGQHQTEAEWPLEVRSALDAVAGLVNPALRLNGEIRRREQAESELRSLNLDLERRVRARTSELARVNADLAALYGLAQQLAGALNLQEVLARGLSLLAGLAGASVCSIWRLYPSGLNCLAAYSPGHHDLTQETQEEAASLASLLRQSVSCTSSLSVLTRSATLPGGRQVLLIPVAAGLPEVHALHLELPGELPADLGLIDAAARAFGLALERQMQTLMLEHAALSDELTGLPNRRALLADLSAELSYSQRHRTSLTLSLFEIADIRAINRTSGFAGGNDLIRALADGLGGTLRTEDQVYRLGGALLATLVRSVDAQESRALVARLDAHALRFELSVAAPGNAAHSHAAPHQSVLRVSHVSAPDETAGLSDLLYLALERLNTPDPDAFDPDIFGPDALNSDTLHSDTLHSDTLHSVTLNPAPFDSDTSSLDASEQGATANDPASHQPSLHQPRLHQPPTPDASPASPVLLPDARLLDTQSGAIPSPEAPPLNPPSKDTQP